MSQPRIAIVILNWNGAKLLAQFLPSVITNSLCEGGQFDDRKTSAGAGKGKDYADADNETSADAGMGGNVTSAHSETSAGMPACKPETHNIYTVSVIVADNGSTDNSTDLLRADFPEVQIIELGINHGFAKGYNEALTQVEADYFILLNSDVEVTPGWLNHLVGLMEEDGSVAAVQPKILSYHKKDEFEYGGAAGGFIDKLGFPFCRGRVLNVNEKDEGQYDTVTNIFWASGACMAVRAQAFRDAGGFDADFWAHMEEIDLCWRLKNMGYRILFTPFSNVYHLGGGTLPYNNPRKLFLNFRNSLWLLYKNLPTGKLYKVMPVRMCLDMAAAFKLLSEGNANGFASVFRAHMSFYKALPLLRKKRRSRKAAHAQELHSYNSGSLGNQKKWHDEIILRSVIWYFYIKRKKTFTEIINS